jgi:hypothetical protein
MESAAPPQSDFTVCFKAFQHFDLVFFDRALGGRVHMRGLNKKDGVGVWVSGGLWHAIMLGGRGDGRW